MGLQKEWQDNMEGTQEEAHTWLGGLVGNYKKLHSLCGLKGIPCDKLDLKATATRLFKRLAEDVIEHTGKDTLGLASMESKGPLMHPRHYHYMELSDKTSSWICDGCKAKGEFSKGRYRCTEGCDFDFCDKCWHEGIPSKEKKEKEFKSNRKQEKNDVRKQKKTKTKEQKKN